MTEAPASPPGSGTGPVPGPSAEAPGAESAPAHRRPLEELTPQQRRRRALHDRWRRPLDTRWARFYAWVNMLFVDHGIMRLIHLNLHQIADDAWRSAQPTPGQIRAFARRGGKTVITLRAGRSFGSLPLEIEACRETGLIFGKLIVRSRGLLSREELLAAEKLLKSIERPVLFHCKSGADRVGFASALYLALAEGRPVSEARKQLALRYGHIRFSKTGILDAFFDAYERDTADQPMTLFQWIDTTYDPERIAAEFKATPLGTLIGDGLLRRE